MPLIGGELKCEGVSADVMAVRDNPSSCRVGAGRLGGGVNGRGGREGDDVLDEGSPLADTDSLKSRLGFLSGAFALPSRSGRRCMNVDNKLEKRLLARN